MGINPVKLISFDRFLVKLDRLNGKYQSNFWTNSGQVFAPTPYVFCRLQLQVLVGTEFWTCSHLQNPRAEWFLRLSYVTKPKLGADMSATTAMRLAHAASRELHSHCSDAELLRRFV